MFLFLLGDCVIVWVSNGDLNGERERRGTESGRFFFM